MRGPTTILDLGFAPRPQSKIDCPRTGQPSYWPIPLTDRQTTTTSVVKMQKPTGFHGRLHHLLRSGQVPIYSRSFVASVKYQLCSRLQRTFGPPRHETCASLATV